jgi:hypothetical protein
MKELFKTQIRNPEKEKEKEEIKIKLDLGELIRPREETSPRPTFPQTRIGTAPSLLLADRWDPPVITVITPPLSLPLPVTFAGVTSPALLAP